MNGQFIAMAKQGFRFGAINSADIKFRLIGTNGEEYHKNPIHLHSKVLQKSEFFKAMLSERWSSSIPSLEFEATTSHSFESYLKCIEFMYSSYVTFSDVDECLGTLSVASELLVDDCINLCMSYLEAVRWSCEQESKIRNLLSSLELKLLPDLAARLHTQDNNYLDFIRENVKSMVSFVSKGNDDKQPNIREIVNEFFVDNMQGNASPEVADMCRCILVEGFKENIEIIKSSYKKKINSTRDAAFPALTRLFKLIESCDCDGRTFEAVLKTFCADKEFAYLLATNFSAVMCENMVHILIGFLEALGNGKTIIGRAFRVSFLTTWLPVMAFLSHWERRDGCRSSISHNSELKDRLCKEVIKVVQTLPFVDWKPIYQIWVNACNSNYIDLAIPFTWGCKELLDAHYKPEASD